MLYFGSTYRARKYMRDNYWEELVPGFGTHQVLRFVNEFAQSGTWIDLGAGSQTLFWSMALPQMDKITAVDKDPYALKMLGDLRETYYFPRGYRDAGNLFSARRSHYDHQRKALSSLVRSDLLGSYVANAQLPKANCVTAFGLYGLSQNPEAFIKSVARASRIVKRDGSLILVSWIFSNKLARVRKFRNDWLNKSLAKTMSNRLELELVECRTITPDLQDDYQRVECIALRA